MYQCEFCQIFDIDSTVCSHCHRARYGSQEQNEPVLNNQGAVSLNGGGFSTIESDGIFDLNQQNIPGVTNDQNFDYGSQQQFGDWALAAASLDPSFFDSLIDQNSTEGSEIPAPESVDISTFVNPSNAGDQHQGGNSAQQRSEANTSPKYRYEQVARHYAITPNMHALSDFSKDWLMQRVKIILNDLNTFGFCTIDNFLGKPKALQLLHEVENLRDRMGDGNVRSEAVHNIVRGDKTTWVAGNEEGCANIHRLIETVDTIMGTANKDVDARLMARHTIKNRTKAMVACYPGGGTHYVKHIDNPNEDGRCVTAIYYVNQDWKPTDEGVLRIYPSYDKGHVATIEPIFDRVVFFWSDRRSPHEVLPSRSVRYAITIWYIDDAEVERRNAALAY